MGCFADSTGRGPPGWAGPDCFQGGKARLSLNPPGGAREQSAGPGGRARWALGHHQKVAISAKPKLPSLCLPLSLLPTSRLHPSQGAPHLPLYSLGASCQPHPTPHPYSARHSNSPPRTPPHQHPEWSPGFLRAQTLCSAFLLPAGVKVAS